MRERKKGAGSLHTRRPSARNMGARIEPGGGAGGEGSFYMQTLMIREEASSRSPAQRSLIMPVLTLGSFDKATGRSRLLAVKSGARRADRPVSIVVDRLEPTINLHRSRPVKLGRGSLCRGSTAD